MCIVFLHHPNDDKSKYKLVLAANRDEYFARPAKAADFHSEHPDVLCGVDMEVGVEGGTWLGVTKSGKFSALTNHLAASLEPTRLPRGRLVLDFLSSNTDPLDYLEALQSDDYRGFNLIAGGFDKEGKIKVGFYSNRDGQQPRVLHSTKNVLACTEINGKWRKIIHGQNKFNEILDTHGEMGPEAFTDELFTSLLSDTTCLYPDPLIEHQCGGALSNEVLEKYCSVQILGLLGYGTRTQTVVLIDQHNVLHFAERILSEPRSTGTVWTKRSYSFSIK